jgi:hypothetical protein
MPTLVEVPTWLGFGLMVYTLKENRFDDVALTTRETATECTRLPALAVIVSE